MMWALLLSHRGQPQLDVVVLLWCIFTGWEQNNYPLKPNAPNKSCFTSRAAFAHWRKQCVQTETYRQGDTWKIRTCTVHNHIYENRAKSQTVFRVSSLTHRQLDSSAPRLNDLYPWGTCNMLLPWSTAYVGQQKKQQKLHVAGHKAANKKENYYIDHDYMKLHH